MLPNSTVCMRIAAEQAEFEGTMRLLGVRESVYRYAVSYLSVRTTMSLSMARDRVENTARAAVWQDRDPNELVSAIYR